MKTKQNRLISTVLASILGAVFLTACQNKSMDEAKLVDAVVAQISQSNPEQEVTDEMREKIKSELRLNQVIAEAARKDKLDKDEDVQALIELQTMQILSNKYFEKKLSAYKPTDADLKKLYDAEVKRVTDLSQSANKEYHLRHILLKTEEQAKAVASKLAAGEAFEKLVKESIDPSAAENGGQLGWAPLSQWVPEFGEAAAKLKVGAYSAPVKSQFGYHIIQVMDEPREVKGAAAQAMPEIPPFEQVKSALLDMAKKKHTDELRSEFQKKADALAPSPAKSKDAAKDGAKDATKDAGKGQEKSETPSAEPKN